MQPIITVPPRWRTQSSWSRPMTRPSISSGGQTLLSTMKQRLAAPSDLVDLRHVGRDEGHLGRWREDPDRGRHDACGGGSVVRHRQRLSRPRASGRPYRRPACAAHGHDRWARSPTMIRPPITSAALLAPSSATIITNRARLPPMRIHRHVRHRAGRGRTDRGGRKSAAPAKCGYAKFPNPASRYALTGVFVADRATDQSVWQSPALAPTGVFRQTEMEQALASDFSAAALDGIHGRRCRPDGGHSRLLGLSRQPGEGHGQARGNGCRVRHPAPRAATMRRDR